MEKNRWYKDMVFYQIWPRSFCDGNGDGIGDLAGVLSRLDYLKHLGVDGIWFSPLYASPNADMGYDISDYYSIHPEYGTLEQFRAVLDGAHARGMKVIMDLVVNHTSDEHPWFLASKDKNSPYRDYYFWREGKKRPNNWSSLFEGKAWEWDSEAQAWYLHIFAKKQPDLNMDNPKVRQEVKNIMRFWLDLGVDGFREDVITFISKRQGLPNGLPIPAACGMEHYMDGPNVHKYLREFRQVLNEYDCFVVGEAPMMNEKNALRYITEGPNQELDMMFHFEHMEADCLFTDVFQKPFDLLKLKKAFSKWQYALEGKGWNALYLENHDHPRIISRYGSEEYRVVSGKMLANCYMLQQGTPFIYQGQEIGMVNINLPNPDDYQDVQTINNTRTLRMMGMSKKKAAERISRTARGNARTPVQWDDSPNAGFTTGKPWIPVNPNYKQINAKAEILDGNSIFNHYRRLIAFRKSHPVAIYGDYKEHLADSKELYVYERSLNGKRLLVICSFTEKNVGFWAPEGFDLSKGKLVLANYMENNMHGNGFTMRPYETRVYYFE
ncbi:MAG: alpha-glucosidase [Oscillospiraceae bacterium]|nr:alpha-glucosidase [Oscillospiraceae bacterium]